MKKFGRIHRSPIEERVFAVIGGFAIGALISPIGWWAFQVSGWKEGAALSLAVGLLVALAAGILKTKSFESLVTTVIRILNPP